MKQRLPFVLILASFAIANAIAPTFAVPAIEDSARNGNESLLEFKVSGCKKDLWGSRPRQVSPTSSSESTQPGNRLIARDSVSTPACFLKAAKLANPATAFLGTPSSIPTDAVAFNATATEVSVQTNNRKISFSHQLRYNCCAEIALESQVQGNTIVVTEINQGSSCRCGWCDHSVDASVGPLKPGTYQLQVYGVRNARRQVNQDAAAEIPLLFERTVTIR